MGSMDSMGSMGSMGCSGTAAYGETGLGLENGLIEPWDEPVNDRTILWLRAMIVLWTGGKGIAANLVDRHPSCITLVDGLHLDPFSTNLKRTQAVHQSGNTYL